MSGENVNPDADATEPLVVEDATAVHATFDDTTAYASADDTTVMPPLSAPAAGGASAVPPPGPIPPARPASDATDAPVDKPWNWLGKLIYWGFVGRILAYVGVLGAGSPCSSSRGSSPARCACCSATR